MWSIRRPTRRDQALALPGQTVAFIDTPIYARTSGYLKRWYFDIGAHVRQGDLLAEIETPELDQQLRQARDQLLQMQAALAQAQASMELAKVTSGRSATLVRQGWTSQQQGDQDRLTYAGSIAAVDAARANLQAQQAEVDRLQELAGFERVVAPFDGEITARNTDVGALINAGAGGPATELFHMAATKTLRIFVAVPEIYFPAMHAGAAATVTLEEYPGQVFNGRLVRTDNAINPASRTLLVEVDVDNADGQVATRRLCVRSFYAAGASAVDDHPRQRPAIPQRGTSRRHCARWSRAAGADHHRPRLWRSGGSAVRPDSDRPGHPQSLGLAAQRHSGAAGR